MLLATTKPVFIFPCMNEKMYLNPITQRNLNILKNYEYFVEEPREGPLADLEIGKGRLEEPKLIFEYINNYLTSEQIFSGKKILVTAGATKEYIDPVRFISNGSSGKMGFSIAKKAAAMGANVTLIYGDVSEVVPVVDKTIRVSTTEEMLLAVKKEFIENDILIMAAAPADFKPIKKNTKKLPKLKKLNLELEKTPDILKEISLIKQKQVIVGFALQTEDIEKKAKEKLTEKKLDIVVANREGNIGKENASVIIIDRYGNKKAINNLPKDNIASEILMLIKQYITSRR